MAEKHIEKSFNKWAKMRGWYCRKILGSAYGKKGAFDRYYIKQGVVVFIEWKQPGGDASVHQMEEYDELIKHGANAAFHDSLEAAKAWINHFDLDVVGAHP